MMISSEQVREALRYLQTPDKSVPAVAIPDDYAHISPELIARVQCAIATEPDTRDERIEHARMLLEGVPPTSSELAEKIIGRVASDSIR